MKEELLILGIFFSSCGGQLLWYVVAWEENKRKRQIYFCNQARVALSFFS